MDRTGIEAAGAAWMHDVNELDSGFICNRLECAGGMRARSSSGSAAGVEQYGMKYEADVSFETRRHGDDTGPLHVSVNLPTVVTCDDVTGQCRAAGDAMKIHEVIVIGALLGSVSFAATAAPPGAVDAVAAAATADFDLLRAAAERQDPRAMYALGEAFDEGLGVPSDPQQAYDWYVRAAARGHAEAMNRLGTLYAEGRGVACDYVAALAWYQRAAERGSGTAVRNIATMYFYGFGVVQSYEKAASLLQAGARSGNADAENKLGTMYEQGLGERRDLARARELFRKAAAQGYPPGMVNMGRMYAGAIAGDRDDVRAYALIRAAIDAGVPASMQDMALSEFHAVAGRLDAKQLARAETMAIGFSAAIDDDRFRPARSAAGARQIAWN
jgi:TPR repeat protein